MRDWASKHTNRTCLAIEYALQHCPQQCGRSEKGATMKGQDQIVATVIWEPKESFVKGQVIA